MSDARANILSRLRGNVIAEAPAIATSPRSETPLQLDTIEQRIARFIQRQNAVHGEVHQVSANQWIDWLYEQLPQRGIKRVLLVSGPLGDQIAARTLPGVEWLRYTDSVETCKAELFEQVDCAITSSRAGIAETGSLVLWPDANEPRLMSLVPPVHIALLEAAKLYASFADLLEQQNWAQRMPTNALLISGPSKTADIEQTLAYGIHGPKQLVTLILN